jgi:hypothetical protein
MDSNAYNWKWRNNDFFPYSETKNGQYFDYYSTLPIICTECLLSSIDISHFNVIDDQNSVHFKSTLDDKSKLLLSKSTKKRKKMIDVDVVVADNYFNFPRNRLSSLQAYLLAESCSKAISVNKVGVDSFNIGYMNFLSIQFASEDQKPELINNCRTWLSQVLVDPNSYNTLQMSQSYYILMIVSLSVEKFKEVSKYFGDFSTLIKMVPEQDKSPTEINSPAFWYTKAEMIWQKEIEKKSSAFKL